MKKFIIDDEVLDLLPDVKIGVLVVEVAKNKLLSESELLEIKDILDKANKEAKKYLSNEDFASNQVIKVWRDTYQKFPTKKGARCSVENLLKRVLKNNSVGTILPAVDITNAVSLKYALPIGVEDFDKLEGDLHLGVMNGDEDFSLIGSDDIEYPLRGEVAYRDDKGVVCRCLNWRDGERTCVTEFTTKEFIAMELVDTLRLEELELALNELISLLQKYLGVKVISKNILGLHNKEVILDSCKS